MTSERTPGRSPLNALSLVLGSVDAVRNGRALYVLLTSFAAAGLLLAMAERAMARGQPLWGPTLAAAALFVAFYGGNAAGLLTMDDARGEPVRDVGDAVRDALLGPLLFGVVVPVGVLIVGLALLSLMAVVVPLAAPGVWSGAGVGAVVRRLIALMRQRLATVALLMAAVSLLTAGVGALVTFVVMTGGRVVAELGVAVVGVDVPAQQLMAGLFGYGLRSLGAAGAPSGSTGHAAAALIGGGVVFALALVLPGLVYLRGTCAVYLALTDDTDGAAPTPRHNPPWTSTNP